MNLKGESRVDFNLPNNEGLLSSGSSLFHEACHSGSTEMVQLFLKYAGELEVNLNAKDGDEGQTPLMFARCHKDVSEVLLNDSQIDVNARDDNQKAAVKLL